MSSFQAFQFLVTSAKIYQKQRQTFSRIEITKKLNEIKYLSAQKKVPRLSLRKEILHLEHKVSHLLEMEERIKRQDSLKITALKKEVAMMKKKLTVAADKDMSKRVDKLVHLLGETLAKRGVARELIPIPKITHSLAASSRLQRARLLRAKLEALKRQLEIMKLLEKDPQRIRVLDQQMKLWEIQLQIFLRKHPEAEGKSKNISEEQTEKLSEGEEQNTDEFTEHFPPPPQKTLREKEEKEEKKASATSQIKHTFLFEPHVVPEGKLEVDTEKLFPVPPPPKVKVKKEE